MNKGFVVIGIVIATIVILAFVTDDQQTEDGEIKEVKVSGKAETVVTNTTPFKIEFIEEDSNEPFIVNLENGQYSTSLSPAKYQVKVHYTSNIGAGEMFPSSCYAGTFNIDSDKKLDFIC